MPESRRYNNNSYCHSIALALNADIVDKFKDDVFTAYRHYICTRYAKVNLESYVRHNTIEFRQHSGTTDAEKITNWVVFMVGFVEESIMRPVTKKPVMHMLVGFKDRYGIKPNSEGRVAVLNDYLNKRLFAMSGITATQKF